jgi:hypothetical protein
MTKMDTKKSGASITGPMWEWIIVGSQNEFVIEIKVNNLDKTSMHTKTQTATRTILSSQFKLVRMNEGAQPNKAISAHYCDIVWGY